MAATASIRPFQPTDEAAVIDLWKEIFHDEASWNEPAAVIRRKLNVQPDLFLIAVAEEQLVGTVVAGYDGVRGWIHHLAVRPSHRRRGIGSTLMAAAEEGLTKLGCPKVNLQVRATNNAVVAFYGVLGYEIEERTSLGKRLDQAG